MQNEYERIFTLLSALNSLSKIFLKLCGSVFWNFFKIYSKIQFFFLFSTLPSQNGDGVGAIIHYLAALLQYQLKIFNEILSNSTLATIQIL